MSESDEPPMTTLEMIEESYKIELRKLFRMKGPRFEQLSNPEFWRPFSREGLEITEQPMSVLGPDFEQEANKQKVERCRDWLERRGFFVLPDLEWAPQVNFKGMAETMKALKAGGWPAAYIFMFDEPWQWIAQLFPFMGHFLEGAELEASVHGWCLSKPSEVCKGGCSDNFAKPHRDYNFSECNQQDGEPFILVIWMPITDSTVDNGCMYVLPKDADVDFKNEDSRHYLSVSSPVDDNGSVIRFPLESVRPLPGPAGSVICWQGNTIHWGSKCGEYAETPRMSIAMSFRVAKSVMPMSQSEINITGRAPLTQHEVLNMSQRERVSMVAKSLIMYAHWFPTFRGFATNLIDVDLDFLMESS